MNDILKQTYELACQCNCCGRWNAVITRNLDVAKFKCKSCNKKSVIRSKIHGWNVNIKIIPNNINQSDLIKELNSRMEKL